MVDLKKIGEWLISKNLMNKPFNQFSRDEILGLVTVVLSSPGYKIPPGGWQKPFISEAGELIFPPETHPRYRYWDPDGQSIFQTLKDLDAPQSIIDRYVRNVEGVPI